jgi:hypothetical protein
MKQSSGVSMVTSATILGRLIMPEKDDLSIDAAQSLLRLDFPKIDHDRMAELSAKANDGKLDPVEKSELEEYLRVADLLAILQSKARVALKRAGLHP